jgi:hypothetical protein
MKCRLIVSSLLLFGPLGAVLEVAQQPASAPGARDTAPTQSQPQIPSLWNDQRIDEFSGPALKGDRLSTVLDEIEDPAERRAFQALFENRGPAERREVAERFVKQHPRSWFLSQAYEIAAKASIDLGDSKAALEFGGESLKLLPENPLLLVPLADVEIRQGESSEAARHAMLALDCLDRFVGPSTFPAKEWAALEKQLRASSLYILARAETSEGLKASDKTREAKLRNAEEHAVRSRALNPFDPATAYLLGLIRLARGEQKAAASAFALAYRQEGPLKARAEERLRTLYAQWNSEQAKPGFDEFVRRIDTTADDSLPEPEASGDTRHREGAAPSYAGSGSCASCHPREYAGWQNTGHAHMFQPYRFENVFGDFNNATYTDDVGNVVARMTHDDVQHYFEVLGAEGQWHRYRVDYTIGVKWQQTYATRLAGGEIQVFPLQYNRQEKRWIAFWRMIDAPKSERGLVINFPKHSSDTAYLAHCGPCHTSQLRLTKILAPEAKDLAFREPGINCEMCHGPSGDHVASLRHATPGTKPALKLQVEFGKISNRDYVAICAQCHMQSAMLGLGPNGEINYRHSADTFYEHYRSRPYAEFALRAFYKDGRFRVVSFLVESFVRSKCYQKGGAHCGHCHDFHPADKGNERALKFPDQPDQMCLQCHPRYATNLEKHTRHPARSEGSRCVACHMPKIMNSVLFKTMTHRLDDIPNVEMTTRFGQKDSPNACLICHTDKSVEWLRAELDKWHDSKPPVAASHVTRPAL